MKQPRLTIQNFHQTFPDNETCLRYLFQTLHPNPTCPKCDQTGKYHLRKGSAHYICNCGRSQISPKHGTIFGHSPTDLVKWFFAIFLMSQSRNGVAAKEIERHAGVTYKTAWRMAHQIRKLMQESDSLLFGDIEADETMIGGRHPGKRGRGAAGKVILFGKLQREGKLNTAIVPDVKAKTLMPHFKDSIAKGSRLLTDELWSYKKIAKVLKLKHETVNHGRREYARGTAHVNSLEGFWSQLKRSLDGTHHVVSPKWLHSYVSEFQWRYNYRLSPIHLFDLLLKRVSLRPSEVA